MNWEPMTSASVIRQVLITVLNTSLVSVCLWSQTPEDQLKERIADYWDHGIEKYFLVVTVSNPEKTGYSAIPFVTKDGEHIRNLLKDRLHYTPIVENNGGLLSDTATRPMLQD